MSIMPCTARFLSTVYFNTKRLHISHLKCIVRTGVDYEIILTQSLTKCVFITIHGQWSPLTFSLLKYFLILFVFDCYAHVTRDDVHVTGRLVPRKCSRLADSRNQGPVSD